MTFQKCECCGEVYDTRWAVFVWWRNREITLAKIRLKKLWLNARLVALRTEDWFLDRALGFLDWMKNA